MGPVLDGVPGIVERSGFRALRLQVMGEPVVQAATERGGRIRLSQTGGVRRWKGPIRGKDLDTPSWNGKDGFVHDTEMRGIGLVVSELRTPSVIQNDGVTTHLDGVGWSTLAGFVLRNGDQTFRPGPEMGASFPTEKRDPLLWETRTSISTMQSTVSRVMNINNSTNLKPSRPFTLRYIMRNSSG